MTFLCHFLYDPTKQREKKMTFWMRVQAGECSDSLLFSVFSQTSVLEKKKKKGWVWGWKGDIKKNFK